MLTINPTEVQPIWRVIDGFAQYEISNDGRCRKKTKEGYRLIKPSLNNDHYQITLTGEFRNRKHMYVHRLVLINFGPEQPVGKTLALHKDDDPANNHIDNICWGDKSDNGKMAVANGRIRPIAEHKFLTREEAANVRDLYRLGQSMLTIAISFGCSRWTVSNVINNRVKRLR